MTTKVAQLQPPVKGLNLRTPAILLDPQEALVLDNVLPQASNGELRAGYKEHVTGIPGAVVTIAPFYGDTPDESRVFAFNDQGDVYDVTESSDKPLKVLDTTQEDGNWDYTNSSNGSENYLIIVAPSGGYYTYCHSAGWVKQTISGDGADKKFKSVFNWKKRVWLIEDMSCKSYYLDVGAITGPAHIVDMAPVINRGGYLSYGCNWTYNAGYDIDDYMVMVTTGGEVIVYKGSDPSDISTFALQGVWFVGNTPAGNKCFTQFGGEMFIMSSLGVVPISKLVNGGVANDYQVSSAKIQPALSQAFNTYSGEFGWEMDLIYNQNFLLLKLPRQSNGRYKSYVMNVQTGAWGTISVMPMNCTIQINDSLYFGSVDGKVYRGFYGDTDGQLLDSTPGRAIVGSYMGGFNDYDDATHLKIFQMARPIYVSKQAPRTGVNMITTYEAALPTSISGYDVQANDGVWDVSKWNQCVWAGGKSTFASWCGLQGMGYYGAVGMTFTGVAGTQYISTNVTFDVGGVM